MMSCIFRIVQDGDSRANVQPIPEPLPRPHRPEPTCSVGRLKPVAHSIGPVSLILMARLLNDPPFGYLSDTRQTQFSSRTNLHIGEAESKPKGQRQGNDVAGAVLAF